jgi:riboflavin synthase
LEVRGRVATDGLRIGDSVAVNGVCLTAVRIDGDRFAADLSPETLRHTDLGSLRPGDPVNLEPAVAIGGRLGGHLVQGHVDGTGRVLSIRREGDSRIFRLSVPKRLSRYVVEKGFIAVDGISLTVVSVGVGSFTVAVIPHTFKHTNLHTKQPGQRVNLEADIFAKYVERLMEAKQG